MSALPLMTLPAAFPAGTTVTYTRSCGDYPASDGWTLTLYIRGAYVVPPIAATPNANGRDYDITITAASTAAAPPGNYAFEERAKKGSEVRVLCAGTVALTANIETAGAGDMLTMEERALPVLEAALAGRLTADQQSFQIAGRAVVKIPIEELRTIHRDFKFVVAQRRRGNRMGEVRVAFPGHYGEGWRRPS